MRRDFSGGGKERAPPGTLDVLVGRELLADVLTLRAPKAWLRLGTKSVGIYEHRNTLGYRESSSKTLAVEGIGLNKALGWQQHVGSPRRRVQCPFGLPLCARRGPTFDCAFFLT